MRTITHPLSVFVACGAACLGSCAGTQAAPEPQPEEVVQVQFLEIVTEDADATCASLAALHGVTFSDPVAEFGNARTAELEGGGLLSVRAPMHAAEKSVVRPYLLVDDIEAAARAAVAAGGQLAVPPTEIPGRGTFAIYFQGGIEHGLWQD